MKFQLPFPSILILMFATSIPDANAQDVESNIASLNESLGATYKVSHKGKILIVESFREGKQVKEDKINVFDLDTTSIAFVPDENIVVVKCHSDLDGCVERTLTQNRKKSYRQRLAFGVEDDKSGTEIEAGLRSVINSMNTKY